MKKHYLGIVCLIYSIIIIYVYLSNNLGNYLAPNMQGYILVSVIPLIIIGLVLCFNNKISYKFRVSDLILMLPIIMIIISGDGKLSMSLSNNRNNGLMKESNSNDIVEELDNDTGDISSNKDVDNTDEVEEYDFSNIYFDVIDSTYDTLVNYITYIPKAKVYEGKTIRVRGFTNTSASYVPDGYFAIGKYSISCCAADATYMGFIAKYDKAKVNNNTWYEIEGVLVRGKDKNGTDVMTIKVINIKNISDKDEEQYVYQCYAYDDGKCSDVQKYNLEY